MDKEVLDQVEGCCELGEYQGSTTQDLEPAQEAGEDKELPRGGEEERGGGGERDEGGG